MRLVLRPAGVVTSSCPIRPTRSFAGSCDPWPDPGGDPLDERRTPGGDSGGEKSAPWSLGHNATIPGARPTKLTPELRERIEHELAYGAPVVVAAQRVGVAPRSLTRWLSQGHVARPSAPDAELGFATPPPDPAPETGGTIEGRVADAEEGLVAVILAAAPGECRT
jgi:transposase-like protein